MRNKRVLPALLGSVALTLGLVTVSTSINKEVVNAAEETATLSFANTAQRTEIDGDHQVWKQNGITVTNNQGSSTSAVADYVNPVRFYKSSNLTVQFTSDMKSIEFDCSSASYATALESSIPASSGTVSVSSDKVTVILATPDTSFVIASLTGGQVRMDSISVTYESAAGGDDTDEPVVPEDKTEEVKGLFTKYYNEGSYIKDSVLNVNLATKEEIAEHFHASANIRYRKTEYYPEGLTMTTSQTGAEGTYGNESTYSNGDNCVVHTGAGGNYTVKDYNSVDDWFVTLNDFQNSNLTGWVESNGLFTFELPATIVENNTVKEHELTRMAREFVAPMWLAPKVNSVNYIQFSKLTVEEDTENKKLIMKLCVGDDYSSMLLENSDNVFSQVEISLPVITSIADAKLAEDGLPVELSNVTVKSIDVAWNDEYENMSFTVIDNLGNEYYIFRSKVKVYVGDIVNLSGLTGSYNGDKQLAQGSTGEVVVVHTCQYTEVSCTEDSVCASCGKIGTPALGHTEPNAEGNCERCGENIAEINSQITASKTMAELISANGWTSSTTKQSFNLDENVTVQINGGSNTGKAYNGDHIRIYATDSPAGTITISVPDDYELVSVKVSTQTGTYAFLYVDGTSKDICNVVTEVSGSSVVLNSVKNGSDGKQVRVTGIEVVYKKI